MTTKTVAPADRAPKGETPQPASPVVEIVRLAECVEAMNRVHWHLEQASKLLIPPAQAATILDEKLQPWLVLRHTADLMREVRELRNQFAKRERTDG